ncbi:MAG: BatA domain-containing protein [Bacteroidetes bacterium]|nr:BatA domain-containing protein [Bacteroidota bacterium]
MIHFLAPQYLYGLLLLAIPVIIHLFNFRRYKKVLFTNVRFLQELKEETSRVSKLKHLLILLSRLLALLFLILAFAQPFIPSGQAAQGRTDEPVSVFIDNSFSMDAVSSQGTLLEMARLKAREVIRSYPASTRFQVLTNDFEAFQQRLVSRDDAVDEVDRIKLSPVSRRLSEVVLRQKEAFSSASSANGTSYIISDFQKSTADFNVVKQDSSLNITLVALPLQETANVFIDSCWLSSPVVQINQPAELSVRIRNSSEKDAENVPVRLLLNGSQKAVASLSIPSGQSVSTTFSFTISQPGWQKAELSITDHPITFDDSYFFSFEVREKLNVLAVYEGNPSPYLPALFSNDPYFNYSSSGIGNVDYSGFAKQDLIVVDDISTFSSGLSDELKKYIDAGGSLCLFPDSAAELNSWRLFLNLVGADGITGLNTNADKVVQVEMQHPLFDGVFDPQKMKEGKIDYPSAMKYFELATVSQSRKQVLMKLQGGASFLSYYPAGRGNVYLFTVPLSPGFSNLSRHAIFAPLLYRMAVLSVKPFAFANTLGRTEPIVLNTAPPGGDEVFHLVNKKLSSDIIPGVKMMNSGLLIDVGEEITSSGHFELMKGNVVNAVLAFNFDRNESLMTFFTEDEISQELSNAGLSNWTLLKSTVQDVGKTLSVLNKGFSLWKYAIVLALLFLLMETLLIRFWKTA